MTLQPTNLVIVSAPLPDDFRGTPPEFQTALVRRLAIKSSAGTNFFVTGSVEPSTNVGPWLKDGLKWYVFDLDTGRYIPQDISDSTSRLFVVGSGTPDAPTGDAAQIWLRTVSGRVIGWYFWNGTEWRPGGSVPPSGPTASRPSPALDLEQYFDTDINVLIHWERGAWRTVAGTPGDVKFVTPTILASVLAANPGWNYLGDSDQSYIGRVLGVASKDPGATPDSSFATDSGITARVAGDASVGTETVTLTTTQIEQHTHLIGALTALNSQNDARFYRVNTGDNFLAPTPRPPNHAEVRGEGAGGPSGTKIGELPAPASGTMLVTSRQMSLASAGDFTAAAEAHSNVQPTLFLWALTKA